VAAVLAKKARRPASFDNLGRGNTRTGKGKRKRVKKERTPAKFKI